MKKEKGKKKKAYLKPSIEKHKPVARVSGSGTHCGTSKSRVRGDTYYF